MRLAESRIAAVLLIVTFFAVSLLALSPLSAAEAGSSSIDSIPSMRQRVEIMERFWLWKR